MKKRSNFTPMKRFHEILDNYGLKLMEVGTNHLRVFFGGSYIPPDPKPGGYNLCL